MAVDEQNRLGERGGDRSGDSGGTACTDSDNDGMSDSWEIANFGNLSQTNNEDYNNDGYTNLEEFINGTMPVSAASSLVTNLTVSDTTNAANWSICSNLQNGNRRLKRKSLESPLPDKGAG